MRIKPNKTYMRIAAMVILIVMCTLLILSAVFPFPEGTQWSFLSIGTSQAAYANPDWLTGYSYRQQITITDVGGGAINDYAIPIDVAYNSSYAAFRMIAEDGIHEWFVRPSDYYEGTYNRTYNGYYTSDSNVRLQFVDEHTEALSDPITLWTLWGNGDDHCTPSVLVIRNQTGANATHNGKVLVAVGGHGAGYNALQTRRSVYSELNNGGSLNTTFNSSVSVETADSAYAKLCETSDGTIWLFYRYDGLTERYRTYDITTDTWSANTTLAEIGGDGDSGDRTYTMVYEYGNDIHIMFNLSDDSDSGRYKNIWYIKHQGSDGTWRTGNGTQKLTGGGYFDMSDADHTPELLYTSSAGHWTYLWDITVDSSGYPALLYIDDPSYKSEPCDVRTSVWNGTAWAHTDTGINSGRFGTYGYVAGAVFADSDPDVIFSSSPDGSSLQQIQKWENSGGWAKTEDITTNTVGDHFRPMPARHTDSDNLVQLTYCYTERYTSYGNGNWDSTLYAYPIGGVTVIDCNNHARGDFGDIRFTTSDGTTLQPSASSGKPWFQWITTNQSARLWIKAGNLAAEGSITLYVYYGNSTATNGNAQTEIAAQFPFADEFPGSSLNSTRWTTRAGDVTVSGGNLTLSSTSGTRGRIEQNSSNYPGYAGNISIYIRWKGSNDNPANNSGGFCESNDLNNRAIIVYSGTADRMRVWTFEDGSNTYEDIDNMDTANWHTWSMVRFGTSTNITFYRDGTEQYEATSDLPDGTLYTHFYEGTTDAEYVYVDWVFTRGYTTPEADVAIQSEVALSSEITNTPSSNAFGTLAVGSNSSTTINYFQIENTGTGAVDVVIYGTDATGGDDTWTLSDSATAGENQYGLKAGLDDDDDSFDVIVRKTETYNTLVSDLAEDATQDWGLQLIMPSALSDYDNNQMAATITLVASAA